MKKASCSYPENPLKARKKAFPSIAWMGQFPTAANIDFVSQQGRRNRLGSREREIEVVGPPPRFSNPYPPSPSSTLRYHCWYVLPVGEGFNHAGDYVDINVNGAFLFFVYGACYHDHNFATNFMEIIAQRLDTTQLNHCSLKCLATDHVQEQDNLRLKKFQVMELYNVQRFNHQGVPLPALPKSEHEAFEAYVGLLLAFEAYVGLLLVKSAVIGVVSEWQVQELFLITFHSRLSRGIAQVNERQYARAISIFHQSLREDLAYPEALIGRGTTYAFKRELDSAVADFTKSFDSSFRNFFHGVISNSLL
ncbi:hypothetical protein L2E82_30142 [Cichorium intybus]|uniref:Uncharacterized protein n=1 Tax=Cichorium intybus TaxID=13427 RepID=A0ACB9CZT1_CICIN|nr:hypothetical protein L2E82_30142 [Cichorium intybus]